jgi:hypothetical protein
VAHKILVTAGPRTVVQGTRLPVSDTAGVYVDRDNVRGEGLLVVAGLANLVLGQLEKVMVRS